MIRHVNLPDGYDWGEDGRTVAGRIFPFGVRAHVVEAGEEFDEEFLPGCTEALRAHARARGGPTWIKFTLDHLHDFDREMGHCAALDERADGVHAVFRLKDDPVRIDNWRSMLRESHTGLSIEFADRARPNIVGSLRQRRQIHIGAVSATPVPVYVDAKVTAMRADEPPQYGTPNLDRVRAMLAKQH